MKRVTGILAFLLLVTLTFIAGCKKDDPPEDDGQEEYGKVSFEFLHKVDGNDLVTDSLMYVNDAGNKYLVNEIQYFISDVTLHYDNGSTYLIDAWKDIHYVDTDLENTHTWNVFDNIPLGTVKKISFTFGISEAKNHSLMFTDPPESLMFWPEYLGGGYHYMKLNGKWETPEGVMHPFDFHLGIGQIYDNQGNITGFIQNYFTVQLEEPGFSLFTVDPDYVTNIQFIMNIENWFRDPNTYNHNEWGGDIMQKQEAMILGCENGHDVFSIGAIIQPYK
jgi:hypothetical protein